jgi:hypothetical protein
MADFLAGNGSLARFQINGDVLGADIARAIIGTPSLSMSVTQVTQITVVVHDPDFEFLKSGVLSSRAPVTFDDEQMEISVIQTGGTVTPSLTLKARSRGPQRLKDDKGAKVFSGLSPTALAQQSATDAGMGFRGQPSPTRAAISRVGATAQGGVAQSQWDLLRDLAAQEGFLMFDVGNVLHFGKPTWFVANPSRLWKLVFPSPSGSEVEDLYSLSVPQCRRSSNDEDEAVSTSVSVPWEAGSLMRPGQVLRLSGVPTFDADYIIDSVDVPLDGRSPVDVAASTPVDPEPQAEADDDIDRVPGSYDDFGAPTSGAKSGTRDPFSRNGVFLWPVRGVVTSGYGPRNVKGGSRFHQGVDIGGNDGVTIYAAAAGRVIRAAFDPSGYGWNVIIDHGDVSDVVLAKFQTLYGHMRSKPMVSATSRSPARSAFSPVIVGDLVAAGQPIGLVGSTGASTGPHLHFEVRFRGLSVLTRVDPTAFLAGDPDPIFRLPKGAN